MDSRDRCAYIHKRVRQLGLRDNILDVQQGRLDVFYDTDSSNVIIVKAPATLAFYAGALTGKHKLSSGIMGSGTVAVEGGVVDVDFDCL